MTDQKRIRNFSVIAHIDHGKSTLADRLLEFTGTLSSNEMQDQVLDSMELERERGITIKMHAIRMEYGAEDGETYILNLIDTPGHVDFSYEVSRSLAACEGAILVVDAAQGVEAQTVSNLYQAISADLEIIPVINKIDLPSAQIPLVTQEIRDLLGIEEKDILQVSAKTGQGIRELLEAIVSRVPEPKGDPDAPLRALIFDSVYDSYRGAVVYVRVVDGAIYPGQKVRLAATNAVHEVDEVGFLRLGRVARNSLQAGEVGFVVASIKTISEARVGDTILDNSAPAVVPLKGYQEVKPMLFAGIYPVDAEMYEDLRDSLARLKLNDASLVYEPESSAALGFGFRCGFLGLLHMEIVQERLDREFGLNIITTVPNVRYRVVTTSNEVIWVDNPSKLPDPARIERVEEPFLLTQIVTPTDYIGPIMKLATERRGVYETTEYLSPKTVDMRFQMPLSEIVFDFYDKLKSQTRGYASFDYEFAEYRPSKLVKLDILINGNPVDALSVIVHADKAFAWGRNFCLKLKHLIPRQLFEVVIQGAIGSRVIAREVVRPLRKDVTAKCYGGDITRKRKLLEKQREGKKRMKQVGSVEIPQEAFLAVLQMDPG
ncbi:MAG TPA: translation elongation factor 4 [Candidatus Latescibacteria bacterium]|nr:translation elongation factor 4 [Candidatus Latescibacterota bacterium]